MLSIEKNIHFLRVLIVFTILAMTGIGGLFDTESLIFIGFPLFDYATLLVILYFIFTIQDRLRIGAVLTPTIYIPLLTLVIIVSMPFRGDETIIQAFQVGRRFFVLLFAYVVMDDIKKEEGYGFILELLHIFAVYYSLLVIFNYIFPGMITTIWKGIGTLDDLKGNVQRHVLKANDGLLFVHLGFVLQFCRIVLIVDSRNVKNIIYLIFLFISIFMMGFRAIMMSTIIASILGFILIRKETEKNNIVKFTHIINTGCFILILLIVVDIILGNALSGTIDFAGDELTGAASGTLQGRLNRSLEYQIPMFLNEPLFGVGLVNIKSGMAQSLGYIRDIDYSQSLYYFDFGYGTLLVMFGIIGGLLFIGTLLYCIKGCLDCLKHELSVCPLACIIFIITLLICNYSFGALETTLGLLPLSVMIGMAGFEDQFEIIKES